MASTATPTRDESHEITELFEEWLRNYYRNDIGALAQKFPSEQRSLVVDWQELYRFDPDLADDFLEHPGQFRGYLEEALRRVDIPADVDLGGAHVRMYNLPDGRTFYPTEFSPTKEAGEYRTIRGDVLVATETYAKVEVAVFECKRCGTTTRIPQSGEWQEPYECQGCERQGPFEINYEQSEYVDGETIQLQTPPERSAGMGRTLQVFVEDDLCGQVDMGDRIAVSGILHLNQKSNSGKKKIEFEPYLEGHHIEIEEATQADLDVDADTRDRVEALAAGEEGDPLTVAAESFAPEVFGHMTEKKALVLAIIGGATNTPDIRGKFHVLLIGDPSTSKSILIGRVDDIAVRSLAVSSKQSSGAGLTSTATQGEFSDGRWTLQPGAFVKANEGVVVIDELDDMVPEDRKSMLEPMANQEINVSKAGINATLSTQTAVTAAANPKYSRFDPYEPLDEQFGFDSNLISRFDLVFTFRDRPDEEGDEDIADHMTQYRDAKIRRERGEDVPEEQQEVVDKPVSDEILQVWLTLAQRQPDPVYESDDVRQQLRDSFVALRGANGYADDAEVPVTFRKLPGVERVARAHAKLEFSPVVTERHAKQAMAMVGQSMQDYQTTEDGTLDADIAETGESKSQRDRKQAVIEEMRSLQNEDDDGIAAKEKIIENLNDDFERSKIQRDIEKFLQQGEASEPKNGYVRYIGRF